MDRTTRQHFNRVLVLAQALVYVQRLRPSVHSIKREGQRDIELADAEAAILGLDAHVIGRNVYHAEGVTYTIAGKKADGEDVRIVVAFNDDDVEEATELTVVTVMHPA